MSAYCICPSTFQHNEGNLYDILMNKVLHPNNNIILDQENRLMAAYSLLIDRQNAAIFHIFESSLNIEEISRRIINSAYVIGDEIDSSSIVSTTSHALTVKNKTIICHSSDTYNEYIPELRRSHISLCNAGDAMNTNEIDQFVHLNISLLHKKLRRSVQSLCDRLLFKGKTEDECNDQIRDLLDLCGFDIHDQVRRGVSQRGYSAGEVDLLIKNGETPHTLIECMKLNSVQREYILTHINKALINYDPLGVRNFYIISYYNGNDFINFSTRYYDYIATIRTIGEGTASPVVINQAELCETEFTGYREILTQGERRGTPITCHHLLVDMS